jgi:WD40 repeat protein
MEVKDPKPKGSYQNSEGASSFPSRCDVFISYSRRDQAFVRRIFNALTEDQRRVWVDWEGIPPTADWMREVFSAIESADIFLFVLSAASLASDVCRSEVKHAVECRKRLVPLVWGQVEASKVPAELGRLNWIICNNEDDIPLAFAKLQSALTTDLEWVREHTRLLVRAVDWRDGRADNSLLLRGADLREAELWLSQGADKEPKPTDLHRDYVITSRAQETRRSRRTLFVVTIGLVLAIVLAIVAWLQRQEARAQRTIADQRRTEAQRQSLSALTNESAASLSLGHEIEALVAAMKAGAILKQEPELRDGSKAVYRALVALRRAIQETHEVNRIGTGAYRGVTQLAFSPDDQSLYSSGGHAIQRWSIPGRLLSSLETEHSGMADGCPYIQNFAVAPDGRTIATIGNEGGVVLWGNEGRRTGGFEIPVSDFSEGMCSFIIRSKIDFTAGIVSVREQNQESVWSLTGQLLSQNAASSVGDERRTERVSSDDGSLFAQSEEGGTLIVRQTDGGVMLPLQRTPAFAHKNSLLATVSANLDNNVIHIWDLAPRFAPPPGSGVARNDTDTVKKTVRVGNRTFALKNFVAGHLVAGVLSPDSHLAAIIEDRQLGRLTLWRLESNSTSQIAHIDTNQLASADFSEALESLTFSPDSKLLASGGTDGTVKLWGLNGKLIRTLIAHREYANVRFSPDGRLLLTWGEDREGDVAVKLWSADGELLDSLSRGRVTAAWFSDNGLWIQATPQRPHQSKKLTWSLDLDYLLRAGCDRLRLYLANPAVHEDLSVCR